jgi:hypothetical protein
MRRCSALERRFKTVSRSTRRGCKISKKSVTMTTSLSTSGSTSDSKINSRTFFAASVKW